MAALLIVDDDRDFAAAVECVLKQDGHEVEVRHDIDGALEALARRRPDLLLLDVMFPEDPSAGFRLARRVRHFDEALGDLPILMMTAINERFPLGFTARDIDDAWLPVADFVEKPIDFAILRQKVERLLAEANKRTDTDV